MDGYFAGFGSENLPFDAYNVTHVIFFEIGVRFLAHAVPRHIDLNVSLQILHVAKGCFAHNALAHHTARNGHGFAFQRVKTVMDLLTVMGYVILCDLERVSARLLQGRKLLPSHLQKLIDILLYRCHIAVLSRILQFDLWISNTLY